MADTVFENPYVKGLLYKVVHSNISKTLNKSSEDQIASKIKNCISSVISNNDLKIESSDIKVDDGYQVLLDSSKLFMIFKNDESWLLKTRQLIRWRQSLNSKADNRVYSIVLFYFPWYNRFINRQKTCAIEIRRLMKKEVKDIRYNVRMTKQTFDIVDSF